MKPQRLKHEIGSLGRSNISGNLETCAKGKDKKKKRVINSEKVYKKQLCTTSRGVSHSMVV